MHMYERIMQLIQHLGLKPAEFERNCSLSNGAVSKMGDNTRRSTLDKISKTYPSVNISWLLTGEGEMMHKEPSASPAETRPRLPMTVRGGLPSGFDNGVVLSECELLPVIPNLPAYDFTMIVTGDSMKPYFVGGDEIAIRRVHDIIEWGQVYVLATPDGAIIKRLYDDGDSFRCVSYNSEYQDFKVNKTSVYGVYKVVGLIRI